MNTAIKELTQEKAQALLEAGVHYGQPTSKRSPKMDDFVYGVTSSSMQIIDLNQTWQKVQEAGELIRKLMSEDKSILFVGTNERAVATVIEEYAEKYDLNFITSRWLGGTLTNPVTRNRINYLRELEGMEQSGLMESISAKEKSFLTKKLKKLKKNLGGLKKIRGAVHAIVLIDPVHELNATLEAFKKNKTMSIIALADTNCHFSPDAFDVTIPCNVSSLNSLRTIMNELMGFYEEGKKEGRGSSSPMAQGGPRLGKRIGGMGPGPRKPVEIRQSNQDNKSNPQQNNKEAAPVKESVQGPAQEVASAEKGE